MTFKRLCSSFFAYCCPSYHFFHRLSQNCCIFLYRTATVLEIYGCFIYKVFMRLLGPVMFTGANVLITSIAFIFFFSFFPDAGSHLSNWALAFFYLFGSWLLLNIYFNYFACSFTSVGHPNSCSDPGRVLGERVSIIEGRKVFEVKYQLEVEPYVSYRYCARCQCIKPPRAHHCRVMEKCVLDMDHYCPWMNNCVGRRNYRYFILYLIYMVVGCVFVIVFVVMESVALTANERSFIAQRSSFQVSFLPIQNISAAEYAFTLALSALVSVGVLLAWHVYLILSNQTSIEFYINLEHKYRLAEEGSSNPNLTPLVFSNPFDEGWRKNIRRVFGDVPWYRDLLPSRREPPQPKYPTDAPVIQATLRTGSRGNNLV